MKRRNQMKHPTLGDFKNNCSEMVRRYDAKIIRLVFESAHEKVYWNGAVPSIIKKDVLKEMDLVFKKERVSVFHLESIVDEILTYFGKFLILLDSGKLRQN
ncbi:MAG: hypothetical protein KBA66_05735 [Leptospiraceae bacterium]|nr:hypothetical protein [Leptospiraceae bacterium]